MIILDTNILIALTIEDHEFHKMVMKELSKMGGSLGTTLINLIEFVLVLKKLKIF